MYYSPTFPELLGRICKTYTEAFTIDKSLSTVYGGIVGMRALGPEITQKVLLEELDTLYEHLSIVDDGNSRRGEERFALDKCKEALRVTLGEMMEEVKKTSIVWG